MPRRQAQTIGGERVGMQASKIKFNHWEAYVMRDPDSEEHPAPLLRVWPKKIVTTRTDNGPAGVESKVIVQVDVKDDPERRRIEVEPQQLLGLEQQFTELLERVERERAASKANETAREDRAVKALKMLRSVGVEPRYTGGYNRFAKAVRRPTELRLEGDALQALIDKLAEFGVPIPNDLTLTEDD